MATSLLMVYDLRAAEEDLAPHSNKNVTSQQYAGEIWLHYGRLPQYEPNEEFLLCPKLACDSKVSSKRNRRGNLHDLDQSPEFILYLSRQRNTPHLSPTSEKL